MRQSQPWHNRQPDRRSRANVAAVSKSTDCARIIQSTALTSRRAGSARTGYTLTEILVTIALIGLLLAIALPAIQQARSAARRTQCVANLRQLGLAMHNYHDAYRMFPPGSVNMLSMYPRMLPYLDQAALYAQVDFDDYESPANRPLRKTPLSVLICTSDPESAGKPYTNYVGNIGTGMRNHQKMLGVFVHIHSPDFQEVPVSAASVSDGLSNTAAFSESRVSGFHHMQLDTFRDGDPLRLVWSVTKSKFLDGNRETMLQKFESACHVLPPTSEISSVDRGRDWLEGGTVYTTYNHSFTPNKRSCTPGSSVLEAAYTANSLHAGGVNLCLADSSVRFVSDSVDSSVWSAIATRSGGESVSEF